MLLTCGVECAFDDVELVSSELGVELAPGYVEGLGDDVELCSESF
jgi:hypothetical protein